MKSIALAAVIVLVGMTETARAGYIIYSDFGPGQAYDKSTYYSVSGGGGGSFPFGFALAESFTPTYNFLFDSVELPLGLAIPGTTNSFTVSLMSDTGGHPGT